ncbi:MAG: CPBP family intramembrane metalloprotease [Spirochaetales bacterium]|nr:MAG: CPBP family intramembrane metalloprotease [Spirochaetales bacterium]
MVKIEPVKQSPVSAGFAGRAGLFVLFLICALAVFLFGSNYYKAFPTNGSRVYSACLTVLFLAAALLLKRGKKTAAYWQIAYAFFAASAVNLVSAFFAGYNRNILGALGLVTGTSAGLALGKVYDALLVVIPIIVLILVSGRNLRSLLLGKGNLTWGLGIGGLVLVNFFTSALIFFSSGYSGTAILGSAVLWGAVFAISNGFLEELWFRGLFFKQLLPVLGTVGTIALTSAWFASIHALSVAYLPMAVIPVFLVNTFTLGLACGIIMFKTDSIWGAVLIHAAADWFLFIAMLAAR